jgi:hypothetical protein
MIRRTGTMEYRARERFGLLHLDARELDHLGPLLGLLSDEFCEFGR